MLPAASDTAIQYPDSDGRRMAENTLQAEWIITLFGNLDWIFADRPDVFVAMDNLWYPVEGKPKRRAAPDVYVAFGRPKGRRGSYKQWEEGGVPLTVVFEVLSPGNRHQEMIRKFRFYERYGVEEYYVIDPDRHTFEAWYRTGPRFRGVRINGGLVSPRLGVRFAWNPGSDVEVFGPDGKRFRSFVEVATEMRRAQKQAAALKSANEQLAEAEKLLTAVTDRAAALAAKLGALGIDPDAV